MGDGDHRCVIQQPVLAIRTRWRQIAAATKGRACFCAGELERAAERDASWTIGNERRMMCFESRRSLVWRPDQPVVANARFGINSP